MKEISTISVVGDGAWGTTLAVYLAQKKYPVLLWGPFADYVKQVERSRENTKFLPGIKLPANIKLTSDLKSALDYGDLIVYAVPSQFTAQTLKNIKKQKTDLSKKIILSLTKGIDNSTLLTMSQMMKKELGAKITIAVLSGPTIASEVAHGIPSTAVIAAPSLKTAQALQKIISSNTFRIYTNTDMIGVELGGSIKNIIAVACGLCDGLGYGTNSKAALLTRGLAEISKLGKALKAKEQTFFGLSGLGDLVTTCFSPKSRNRTVGEALGRGKKIKEILSKMDAVAEGIETVKGAYKLSRKLKISMPITSEIYKIVYKNKKPQKAVADLMKRRVGSE